MPKPTGDLLKRLGPAVQPYQRQKENNPSLSHLQPLDGEKKLFENYDATEDDMPPAVVLADEKNLGKDAVYLWIITSKGLFLIIEQTPNPDAQRGHVCHTNITAGKKALQGGELWFIGGNKVCINYKSGRYGAQNDMHKIAVIEYFRLVGYEPSLV